MIDVLESLVSPRAATAIAAPGAREGYWAGAPSAVQVDDSIWLAYRLRRPIELGRGYANVVARSADGVRFDTVAVVTSSQFRCASLERPSLVTLADGGWRLYVSCATPGSKHWWVEAIDAASPQELPHGGRSVVLDADDAAWKDVVVKRAGNGWQMWACRHPLDGGDDAADQMSTWYATSNDGLAWTLVGEALGPRADTWDARGARVADVVHARGRWWALYDGRRSAEENWRERSGLAVGDAPHALNAVAGPVPDDVGKAIRYASVVALAEGWRIYFEATAADGSHDLRTVYVPRPSGASQSE
jgi:hypothetical protein